MHQPLNPENELHSDSRPAAQPPLGIWPAPSTGQGEQFPMIDWIKEAGGQNSVATRLAPVIRSLLKETDYPLIRYIPAGETAAAASFSVDAEQTASYVELVSQLKTAKPSDRRSTVSWSMASVLLLPDQPVRRAKANACTAKLPW
jgi:hypothetical protein